MNETEGSEEQAVPALGFLNQFVGSLSSADVVREKRGEVELEEAKFQPYKTPSRKTTD